MSFLKWAIYLLLGVLALRLAMLLAMAADNTRRRNARIWGGDAEAAKYTCNVADFVFGRYHLAVGDSNRGWRGIHRTVTVDPARVVDEKPVVVGHGIRTAWFSISWGLKWPYPWTQRKPDRPPDTSPTH